MIDLIKDLEARSRELDRQARKLDGAVKALQETCEHDWQYDGHGHNDSYYTCRKCAATMCD